MKIITALILSLILMQSCSEYQDLDHNKSTVITTTATVDTTEYRVTGFNNSVTLGFLSDSTFYLKDELWSCTGGGEEKYVFGTFSQQSSKMLLFPLKRYCQNGR